MSSTSYTVLATACYYCVSVCVRTDHVLGTSTLQPGSDWVHDKLLLGQRHLLRAVEQACAQICIRASSDDTLLSVDTFHSSHAGRLSLVCRKFKLFAKWNVSFGLVIIL